MHICSMLRCCLVVARITAVVKSGLKRMKASYHIPELKYLGFTG